MAVKYKRLEITPELLDFGSTIVRVGQIASIGRAEQRPLRLVGVPLILVSCLLLGYELAFNMRAFTLSKGSTGLWAACGALAIGLFCLVYAQRCLAITLAGGSRVMLRAGSQTFTDRLIYEFRRAMTAAPGSHLHIVVDLDEEEFAAGVVDDAGQHRVEGHVHPGYPSAGQPPQHHGPGTPIGTPHVSGPGHLGPPGPLGHAAPVNGVHHAPPHWGMNGAHRGPEPGLAGPPAHALPMPAGQPRAAHGPAPGAHLNGAMPAQPAGQPIWQPHHVPPSRAPVPAGGSHVPHDSGPAAGSLAVAVSRAMPPPPGRDLASLIEFVARSDIQHRDTLIELLKVVEDHEAGGRTSREDARAHWQSFADYVGKYLGNVDGLAHLTERTGASLGGRAA